MDEVHYRSPDEPRGIGPVKLSEREGEVLDLALTGLAARSIAARLSLTEATVRSHLSRIYAKLGVGGQVELLAQMNGAVVRDRPPSTPPPSTPPGFTAEPSWNEHGLRLGILALVLLAAGVGALFAWLRPDLPPSTNLASVSRLVSDRQVTSLDLRGETLFVTTLDGQRFRIDGLDQKTVETIQRTAIAGSIGVSVSAGDGTVATGVAIFGTALAPVAAIAAVAVLLARWLRRPPQAGFNG